ncbi:Uncharacterised protein [Bordetella pertussis]|nr:Uncharacterised protein [Bordetella pertussis]
MDSPSARASAWSNATMPPWCSTEAASAPNTPTATSASTAKTMVRRRPAGRPATSCHSNSAPAAARTGAATKMMMGWAAIQTA